jgi:hypothetical protein
MRIVLFACWLLLCATAAWESREAGVGEAMPNSRTFMGAANYLYQETGEKAYPAAQSSLLIS